MSGSRLKWTPSSSEGRWSGFGPYYAMFPVDFARRQIEQFTEPGDAVLDPFCGRGTVPFVSQVSGRKSLGADMNPVAWLFASTKLSPAETSDEVLRRVRAVLESVRGDDKQAENEFQEWAWHSDVLGFLNAARRELKWKVDVVDRTLMGTILVHLHAKLGEGLSNQLRQSKAMAPSYAVRWWKERNMRPPEIDLSSFFEKKLRWRYAKGIPPKKSAATVLLGDSREVLTDFKEFSADFILTSPPYCGVTNYEYDNWIRLWLLGSPSLPLHRNASRFQNREEYLNLLQKVFSTARSISKENVAVYTRTDARHFTLGATLEVLEREWPNHYMLFRYDRAQGPTQTALYGNSWNKAGEVDILLVDSMSKVPEGFVKITTQHLLDVERIAPIAAKSALTVAW